MVCPSPGYLWVSSPCWGFSPIPPEGLQPLMFFQMLTLASSGILGDMTQYKSAKTKNAHLFVVVFQKWRWPCLHCPSEGIAVDKQANDDVMHLGRFRKADGLAGQAFYARS